MLLPEVNAASSCTSPVSSATLIEVTAAASARCVVTQLVSSILPLLRSMLLIVRGSIILRRISMLGSTPGS